MIESTNVKIDQRNTITRSCELGGVIVALEAPDNSRNTTSFDKSTGGFLDKITNAHVKLATCIGTFSSRDRKAAIHQAMINTENAVFATYLEFTLNRNEYANRGKWSEL